MAIKKPEIQAQPSRPIVRQGSASPQNGSSPSTDYVPVTPLSSEEILASAPPRELILLGGKDGVGKSSAIVSLAWYVRNALNPEAAFFVIDSENKFRSALRSFGADAPDNIVYYKVDNMNQVTEITSQILDAHKPGDWLAVESMSRIWERAQDLGYMAVSGLVKAAYMERRREEKGGGGKAAPVTPQPDHLWNITKGAHDGAFMDRLTACDDLNIILTTIIAKPREGGFIKENPERRAFRAELGIEVGLEGAPRLPYYVECLCLLEMKAGHVTCRVLRDNLNQADETRVEFPVENKKAWAMNFYANCRG